MGKQGIKLSQNADGKMPEWLQLMWRVLGILVIGGQLANWTWILLAPRSASVLPAAQSTSDLQAERLFGVAATSVSVSSLTVSVSMPDVRLVGVFAGHPGFAVLELDGKNQLSVAAGKEIVPGSRLVEVAVDHVVIERGGIRQQILLEGSATAIKRAAAALQPASAALDSVELQHILKNRGGL